MECAGSSAGSVMKQSKQNVVRLLYLSKRGYFIQSRSYIKLISLKMKHLKANGTSSMNTDITSALFTLSLNYSN